MNEVTNQNFKKIYPRLECALKNASFVAIDTELTGIAADNSKASLFDSVKERYDRLRATIQPYIIIQFGITTYQRVQDKNEYTAEAFNFFLLPRTIPSRNRQFLWQVSALEFLVTYGFDFNKALYHGISYLDEADHEILQQQLQKDVLLYNTDRYLSYEEKDYLKDCSFQVAEWLNTKNDETSSFKIDTSTPILQYIVHKELRNCFPNIWTLSGDNLVTVMKVSPDIRKVLEEEEGSILEDVLLESCLGFSRVFNLLVTLKKPIIGHNVLLDLMFMHQQFYKPLPRKYDDFKNNIHRLFPIIYDTKLLSYELRRLVDTEVRWKDTSLGSLFDYFTEKQGKCLTLVSPVIKLIHSIDSDKSDVIVDCMKCHTAGWDAYFAGYIFIKMTHAFAVNHHGQNLTLKYFTHTELFNSVKRFANCINISRANTLHLKLDGPEPESTRPKWLYVKTLASKPIIASKIAETMSVFGTVDVKQFTSKRVLVAVANHANAQDILKYFKQSKELSVVPYSTIRHSPSVRLALWSSIVVSSGIFAWMLHQKLQKTS